VGSALETADLSRNRIGRIRDLQSHFRLETLILDGNHISRIEGLDGLRRLTRLSLNGNLVARISGLASLPLVSLSLDDNNLRCLENLEGLAKLQSLSVARNRIRSLAGLETCLELGSLDASDNEVPLVREAEHLRDLPLFASLSVKGNPCAALPFCRRRVIYCLQRLSTLDGVAVTPEEKVKSINIHGGDESDLGHRKEMYKKFFGSDEAWENTLPPFVETEASPVGEAPTRARVVENLVGGALADALLMTAE